LRLVGILGGTFNPIHFGHLRIAQELAESLNMDEVRFIPSANPPHKPAPTVSAQQRAIMVQLAISNNPLFSCDARELNRQGASYTIDTLISLHAELGAETALCLIMGSDAFLNLNSWHRWQELLDYCHIVLVQRPIIGTQKDLSSLSLSPVLKEFLAQHYTENLDDLSDKNAGFISMHVVTPLAISASEIRKLIAQKQSPRYLLPNAVLDFIVEKTLYTE
jgi:nicotinate-nucleotide adenylyltransferase